MIGPGKALKGKGSDDTWALLCVFTGTYKLAHFHDYS